MKKVVYAALLLCALSAFSTNVLANAFVNFAGVQGFQPITFPFTLTTCTGPANCTPNPIMASYTVTLQAFGGSGGCQTGVCQGTATSLTETFSVPVQAFALFTAPSNTATTVTYWLSGHQVGPTQVQHGGMFNLPKSAHTVFNEVKFSWASPTQFSLDKGTFDAAPVPEPSTLLLVGSGLIGAVGLLRRKRA